MLPEEVPILQIRTVKELRAKLLKHYQDSFAKLIVMLKVREHPQWERFLVWRPQLLRAMMGMKPTQMESNKFQTRSIDNEFSYKHLTRYVNALVSAPPD